MWIGMSEKHQGPAAGTRSRANSDKLKKLPPLPSNQRLVSSFLSAKQTKPVAKYDSDIEHVCRKTRPELRKRSNSGSIYQSKITIATGDANLGPRKSMTIPRKVGIDCTDEDTDYSTLTGRINLTDQSSCAIAKENTIVMAQMCEDNGAGNSIVTEIDAIVANSCHNIARNNNDNGQGINT